MGTFGTRSKNSRLVFTAAGMLSISLLVGAGLAQTPPICQQIKYLLSDGHRFDIAGNTVDLSSDFMFAGKPTQGSPMESGSISSVYIFKSGQTPGSWIEHQVILDSREDGTESLFGVSLNVNEDRLIVQMPREEGPFGITGGASIFRLDVATNTWILEQKLLPFNGTGGVGDVAIDGDFAIIRTEA